MDRQPALRSKLLELRPVRSDDFDALYVVASDPLVWEQHPARDRHEESIFRTFFRDALASGGALVAIDRNTEEAIGSSRYDGYDEERSEIEIGWTFLARSHWGGQYNGEMKRLMLEYAFQFVDAVILLIGEENTRSQRAAEEIGGVRVPSRPDQRDPASVVYRLTSSDHRAR